MKPQHYITEVKKIKSEFKDLDEKILLLKKKEALIIAKVENLAAMRDKLNEQFLKDKKNCQFKINDVVDIVRSSNAKDIITMRITRLKILIIEQMPVVHVIGFSLDKEGNQKSYHSYGFPVFRKSGSDKKVKVMPTSNKKIKNKFK